jgi:hypothetical protein
VHANHVSHAKSIDLLYIAQMTTFARTPSKTLPPLADSLCYNAAIFIMKYQAYPANDNPNANDDPQIVGRSLAG